MGYRVKLRNRRIYGYDAKDGTTSYRFKNLIDGEIFKTEIRLSDEALFAMIDIRNALHKEKTK